VEIADLKQQARALEQQGNTGEALAMYRLILAELDAIGGIRQELPLLIKIGDLQLKAGDVDGAVEMYERAAGEYATQGAAQPVMSLCLKIVRADSQAVGAYLRLARKLLEAGQTDGARRVLMDYAKRAKLDKTREGLERLGGHSEDNVKIVLAKAIDAAEERVPKRIPWARRAAPTPPLEEEEDEGEEPADEESRPEPSGPRKRLTVPVGALDAEPEPSLLEQRPPEERPPEQRQPEVTPESLFPTAADLKAVTPQVPAAPPPAEAPFVAPPLPISESAGSVVTPMQPPGLVEPPRIDAVPLLPETLTPLPPLPPTADASQPKLRVSQELVIDTSFNQPPPSLSAPAPFIPAAEPRPEPPPPSRPSRPSRPQPRLSHVAVAPPRRPSPAPRWLWPVIALVVVAGGVGALFGFGIISVESVRNLFPQREPEPAPVEVRTPPRRPVQPRPDTVMARDTARTEPAPVVQRPAAPLMPPTLPPGMVLTGVVYMVSGLPVESVEEISPENRLGFRIAQVLASGRRIILEEFPADTTIEGEIGVTGLPGDTVVGHVRIGGVDVTLKGVIPETLAVELLQQLVQVRPQD